MNCNKTNGAIYHHDLAWDIHFEVEERCNDDDQDTYINNDGGNAPNDNDYHEPQPQDTNPIIGYASTSKTTKAS